MQTPHNEPNNVNILIRDMDSDITGHGKHNRIVVFLQGNTITAREDILHNLPRSTDEQRRKVMNGWQRMHSKNRPLTFVGSSEPYASGSGTWLSIDHTYTFEVEDC